MESRFNSKILLEKKTEKKYYLLRSKKLKLEGNYERLHEGI